MHAVCSTLNQRKTDGLSEVKFTEQEIIVLDICQSFDHNSSDLSIPANTPANTAVRYLCLHFLQDQVPYFWATIK